MFLFSLRRLQELQKATDYTRVMHTASPMSFGWDVSSIWCRLYWFVQGGQKWAWIYSSSHGSAMSKALGLVTGFISCLCSCVTALGAVFTALEFCSLHFHVWECILWVFLVCACRWHIYKYHLLTYLLTAVIFLSLVSPRMYIHRVGQIKWHHFTFLLVTHECIHKILWFLADINYIMQKMRWC